MDESILFSLEFLSQNSLSKLCLNRGYKGIYIYSRVRRNVKSQFFPNRVFWQLDLATGLSREFKPQANESFWQLAAASRPRDPAMSPYFFAHT